MLYYRDYNQGNIIRLVIYPAAKSDTVLTIPINVHAVGVHAFAGNNKIEELYFNTNEDSAVREIEMYAFYQCTALEKIRFTRNGYINIHKLKIGKFAFAECLNLENIYMINNITASTFVLENDVFSNIKHGAKVHVQNESFGSPNSSNLWHGLLVVS